MSDRSTICNHVACILMILVVLVSCSPNDNDSTNPSKSSESEAPSHAIKLGGTLPLTGPYSDTGRWVERGYRYWTEEVNGKGGLLGHKVDLIIYDDMSDPDMAVSLFERAITQDHLDLLVGGYPGTSAALQMPAAERHRMVYVSMGGHMPSFEQGFSFSFGGPPLMGQWWYEGFWSWLSSLPQKQRPLRMATITLNNIVGLAIREGALAGAARMGIQVVMDELYDLPLTDAEKLVSQAQTKDADLFLASGFFPDGVATLQAMKTINYNPSFLVQGVGCLVPRWEEELGKDGYYVFSGTPLHPRLPFAGIKALNAVAREKFDVEEAPSYFLFGYAWLQTLQAGVEGAGSLNQADIRDYLRSHELVTIGGKLKFDERGLPKPYNYLIQVQPSGVELIWPLTVRTAVPVFPRPAAH